MQEVFKTRIYFEVIIKEAIHSVCTVTRYPGNPSCCGQLRRNLRQQQQTISRHAFIASIILLLAKIETSSSVFLRAKKTYNPSTAVREHITVHPEISPPVARHERVQIPQPLSNANRNFVGCRSTQKPEGDPRKQTNSSTKGESNVAREKTADFGLPSFNRRTDGQPRIRIFRLFLQSKLSVALLWSFVQLLFVVFFLISLFLILRKQETKDATKT